MKLCNIKAAQIQTFKNNFAQFLLLQISFYPIQIHEPYGSSRCLSSFPQTSLPSADNLAQTWRWNDKHKSLHVCPCKSRNPSDKLHNTALWVRSIDKQSRKFRIKYLLFFQRATFFCYLKRCILNNKIYSKSIGFVLLKRLLPIRNFIYNRIINKDKSH